MNQLLMHRPADAPLPPLPSPPPGMTLRAATAADGPALAALLAAAFGDTTWTVERVNEALLGCMDVAATYVIEGEGRVAATASVLLRDDREPASGYLHWVAVDPARQGMRLGALVSLAVLHEFARLGRPSVYLHTDDQRLPAIKTYVNLGFVGVVVDDDAQQRWDALTQRIPAVRTEDASGTR